MQLVIGPDEKVIIDEMVEFARANPLTREFLERCSANFVPEDVTTRDMVIDRFMSDYTRDVGVVSVCYTEENQPFGMARHVSVKLLPDGYNILVPAALDVVLGAFGFSEGGSRDCVIYPEELPGGGVAVNALQPLEPSEEWLTMTHKNWDKFEADRDAGRIK